MVSILHLPPVAFYFLIDHRMGQSWALERAEGLCSRSFQLSLGIW